MHSVFGPIQWSNCVPLIPHDAPLHGPPALYLKAPAAQPPAAGCTDTLRCQTPPAAGGAGCRRTAGGTAGGPRRSPGPPAGSPRPSCPSGSTPHQSCWSRGMAGAPGDPLGLKTVSLQEHGDRRVLQ